MPIDIILNFASADVKYIIRLWNWQKNQEKGGSSKYISSGETDRVPSDIV